MSVGFIKIHRTLFENWVSDEPEALAVWVRILSEANFKDKKKKFNGSLVMVKRGQLIFGLNAFAERSGVSVMKLRRIISDLEGDGMINRQKTNRYSLITVVSYDSYQGLTSQEQSINTQITDKQHADNTQLTTPKECKKGIMEEGNKNKSAAPPVEQVIFDHWKAVMNKNNSTKLNKKRLKAVKSIIKEGYSVDDIKLAIDGCANTPHNMGQNDRGELFNDLELICRNGVNLERFMGNVNRVAVTNQPNKGPGLIIPPQVPQAPTIINQQGYLEHDS